MDPITRKELEQHGQQLTKTISWKDNRPTHLGATEMRNESSRSRRNMENKIQAVTIVLNIVWRCYLY